MDEYEKNEGVERQDREEIFSNAVRAGKRTYFFDVKATRKNDYYITLTESKKRYNRDGRFFFEKHKIFLYKEDFEKFVNGLNDAISFIKENQPQFEEQTSYEEREEANMELEMEGVSASEYSNVEFEDLGNK